MSLKTQRAAFAATALTLVFALASAEGSGAFAQESEPLSDPPQAQVTLLDWDGLGIKLQPQPRFVSQEVVQPLPEPDEDEDEDEFDRQTLHALVSSLPPVNMSDDMMCLAQAIYFESRGEPLSGQLAVGRVIVNRAAADSFPDDYCGVVKQRGQFSFVRNGHIPKANTASRAWDRAVAVARVAHEELWDSEVDDALFFHATHVSPRWARAKIARATIDSHIFYR